MARKTKKTKKPIQIVKANPEKGLMHDTIINHNRTNRIPGTRTHPMRKYGTKT
jgi:hypothetical protein